MPDPNNYENREDFMDACIPQVIDEGTAEDGDQAVAICSSMWRNREKKSRQGMPIITFSVDQHHDRPHELLLPDGIIPAGWYATSTVEGHVHGIRIEHDLLPGQSVTVTTDGGYGYEHEEHAHGPIQITAVEEQGMHGGTEDEEEDRPLETLGVLRSGMETKHSRILEVKQANRNGVPVGIVSGYLSTWEPDTGGIYGVPDQFVRGAFLESLEEHKERGNRPIRLRDHHGRTIGGFPIETVREDERGLFAVGEINLETQDGKEAYSLARQGVLTDFSLGYTALEDKLFPDLRRISKAIVWEGSVIDEPANRGANILEIKGVVSFQDLPLADRERAWNSTRAIQRVRRFTNSEDAPSRSYRRAFLWFDSDNSDSFGAYKLPIADVIDGQLRAVPRAIFAAAQALRGARGGVDIPDGDRRRVIRNVERYYDKLGEESPFSRGESGAIITLDEVLDASPREIEQKLREVGFSVRASKYLTSRLKEEKVSSDEEMLSAILQGLREAKSILTRGRDQS